MKSKQSQQRDTYLIIGIVSVVAIIVVLVLIFGNRPDGATGVDLELDPNLPRGITDDDLHYLGNPDAPVTMLIYEDMGCPNCKNFEETVVPSVIQDYVANGDVKIVVYTVAFINQLSLPGAEGLSCAAEQEKFWEFRELLFKNQGIQAFTRNFLVDLADQLNLDRQKFSSCYDLAKYAQKILRSSQQAVDFGISSTPTVDINGARLVGVYPYEDDQGLTGVKTVIDNALLEGK